MSPKRATYDPNDAPLFHFNEERSHLVREVSRRVYGEYLRASRERESARLEYVLNETAFYEIQRLRTETGPEEEVHDIGWWRSLARRVGEMGEDEKRTILRDLIDTYTDDTAGKFDPRVFKLATGVLPVGLGVLFKTQDLGMLPETVTHLRSGLRHLRDLSERVVIEGELDTLRRLHKKGTLVVVPTHSSNMDSILMGWALEQSGLPPVTYGAGKNLFTNPLTSFFMHNLGAYKVDRRLRHPLYKDVLKTYSQVLLEKGYHSLFFPGGTRCRSNEVEDHLKLGLLGTAVSAFVQNLRQHGEAKPIYICPVTINYNLVLEGESLIKEYLRREGRQRYFLEDDEFNQVSTVVRFVMNTVSMDSTTVIRFGRPLDPFGNDVGAEGDSFDARGRKLDVADFVRSSRTGEVVDDIPRDREYTRHCGERIYERFLENTVIQPSQVVSWALFQIAKSRFGTMDVFRLLRVAAEEIVERYQARAVVAELVGDLKDLADRGHLHLAEFVHDESASEILEDGLSSLTSYHIPNVVEIQGSGIRLDRLELLYFYGNRISSYPIDAADILARAAT
jgi:glycerol-3-phosphate O-acyltransferase